MPDTQSTTDGLTLTLLADIYAIFSVADVQELELDRLLTPRPDTSDKLTAIISEQGTWSVVCPSTFVGGAPEAGIAWRAMRIDGTFALSEVGILAAIADPLAVAEIPIFVISAFPTDYVLIPGDRLDEARSVMAAAGHRMR